jgi:nucleotide-binding universal stress UspA family protein
MYMEPISNCKHEASSRVAAELSRSGIKTILVPVSGSETDRVVLSAAWEIAQPLKAHLEFLHLRLKLEEAAARSPHIGSCRSVAMRDALGDLARDQYNLSASAANYVRQFCLEHGIPSCDAPSGTIGLSADCLEESGPGAATLLFHARRSDLTLLGRAQHADCMPTTLIEEVLVDSGRPLLIIPRGVPRPLLGTVVVGWKESAASARAIAAALPLLQLARRVVIINVAEDNSPGLEALDGVRQQLARHEITAETLRLGDGIATADTLLPGAVADLNAGLLVIGGFGHSRLRETVFGGVTRSLVKSAEFPLFVVH